MTDYFRDSKASKGDPLRDSRRGNLRFGGHMYILTSLRVKLGKLHSLMK